MEFRPSICEVTGRAGIALKTGVLGAWFREQSVSAKDAKVALRLLSLAAIKQSNSRSDEAAKFGGVDRQTLCDWVYRFHAEGVVICRSSDLI